MLGSKGNANTTVLLPRLRGHRREGAERARDPEEVDNCKEISPGQSREVAHRDSEQSQQHAQSLCKPKSEQVPTWRGGLGTQPHPYPWNKWQPFAAGRDTLL